VKKREKDVCRAESSVVQHKKAEVLGDCRNFAFILQDIDRDLEWKGGAGLILGKSKSRTCWGECGGERREAVGGGRNITWDS